MRLLRLLGVVALAFVQAVLALLHYLVSHTFGEAAGLSRPEPSERALLALHGLNAAYLFVVALGLLRPRPKDLPRPGWAVRSSTVLLLVANLAYSVFHLYLFYQLVHEPAGGHRRRVLLTLGGQWLLTLPVLALLAAALYRQRLAARRTSLEA
ncbi:hypothetical protein [Hymenobacter jeollabukensis]|uniref:Uncharacterized protein n=1 Tax=Hymenobacter jeollabukensis TaxID=2025313 RepID=A0A5R8WS91_9BACT|nr:hypothetical protein [Hymenobacter jeollabukensis]TLM93313.1 hypothetical protein FDY95_11890 [Hymenobacter jeollabukensis]